MPAVTQPEDPESTQAPFAGSKLSAWGLAEPSFSYEFIGYSEGTNGPDFVARLYYLASADYAAAQAYVETVVNSGWGGFAPDPDEASPFGYTGNTDDYKLLFYWE